jgi:hypothetical protein
VDSSDLNSPKRRATEKALGALSFARTAGMKGNNMTKDESRIEIASYRLAEGTDEGEFLEAVDAVLADLKTRNSSVGWRLFKGDDGVRVDIVTSPDWEKTNKDFKEVLSLPNAKRMYAMIDPSTLKHDMLTLERTYP